MKQKYLVRTKFAEGECHGIIKIKMFILSGAWIGSENLMGIC